VSGGLTIAVERADRGDVRALLQTVASWSVDGSAELRSIFVVPEARGRGVGQAILAAIEHALRGRVATLRLETGVK
jgi:GNAT superfamily N-acetyltransferase